jgi:hypothetical protein
MLFRSEERGITVKRALLTRPAVEQIKLGIEFTPMGPLSPR